MALKWGILDIGMVSYDFAVAVKTLQESDHQIIAVAVNNNTDDVDKFANEFNIPNKYHTHDDLVKNNEIDVIYIGNSTSQHYKTVKLCLENNKGVLCEAPLCTSSKEVATLVELSQTKNLFLMEGISTRFYYAFQHLMNALKANALGDIKYVSASIGWNRDHSDTYSDIKIKELKGDTISDLGVYATQTIQAIYKNLKPTKIVVNKQNETYIIVLSYASGKMAVLSISSTLTLPGETHVIGSYSMGHIKLPMMWCPTQMIINGHTREFNLPKSEYKTNFTNSTGMAREAEEVNKCIKSGKFESSFVTHQDSVQLVELLEGIKKEIE